MSSKRLSLERYDLEVSEEGYQRILAIARETAVCSDCEQLYSQERPNVAGLLCLSCFQKDHTGLTYTGLLPPDLAPEWTLTPYGPWLRSHHLFLDVTGNATVTTSFPGGDTRGQEWPRITARYWKFPVPAEGQWNNETIPLRRFSLMLFGDPRESETILLRFYDYHDNKTQEVLFLARRNGAVIQINKRKGLHRQLFAEARAELEATKSGDGNYFVDGEWKSWLHESDTYRLVVKKIEDQRKAAEQRPLIATTEEEEEEEEEERG